MPIHCLTCFADVTDDFRKNLEVASNFQPEDILIHRKTHTCSCCGTTSPHIRVINDQKEVLADSRLSVACPSCENVLSLQNIFLIKKNAILANGPVKCSRCQSKVNTKSEQVANELIITRESTSEDFVKYFDYFLPRNDLFFSFELIQGLLKFGEPGYQIPHRKHALKFVKKKSVCLDIGAHIGLWAKPLAREFETLIAFEPNPNSTSFLRKNIPLSTVYDIGLSSKNETHYLNLDVNTTGAAFIDDNPSQKSIAIETRPLDAFDIKKIDFVKMDCEGFEYDVLLGARDTIRRCSPIFNLEQKPHHADRKGVDKFRAVDFLQQEFNYIVLGNIVDEWVLGPSA